jgi:glycosyltransferase involved in cell wall biosynthesis
MGQIFNKMSEMPQVSIIMATYNRAEYILESLQSIQAQTFKDWECLIIDDGGTDDTKEILAPILEQDSRFKYFTRTENYQKGLPGSRNYGLDLAQGDYIIFFDDDDIAHPQNLELCVLELSKNDISFCRYIRDVFFDDFHYKFDYSTTYTFFNIGINDVEKILRYELFFNSCAVMWKRECFVKNRFVEHLMYAEEWELYSRIISAGFKGISIEKCLFYGRKHRYSLTGEFYNYNAVQTSSYADCILLAIKNLKEKQLLSNSLIRYFISLSIGYKQYKLYENILAAVQLNRFEKLKWNLFYKTLPPRLLLYRIKKVIKKNI